MLNDSWLWEMNEVACDGCVNWYLLPVLAVEVTALDGAYIRPNISARPYPFLTPPNITASERVGARLIDKAAPDGLPKRSLPAWMDAIMKRVWSLVDTASRRT